MKNLLIAFALLISNFLMADSWDNLTKEQAEAVVTELKQNPYIFDYCDCCDHQGAYAAKVRLLKVLETEIIKCPWEAESFSVVVDVAVLAHIPYGENGLSFIGLTSNKKETDVFTISMNYTWSFNPGEKMATPMFANIPYDKYGEKKACKSYFKFPTPEEGKGVIKDGKYKKWYKKNISK